MISMLRICITNELLKSIVDIHSDLIRRKIFVIYIKSFLYNVNKKTVQFEKCD